MSLLSSPHHALLLLKHPNNNSNSLTLSPKSPPHFSKFTKFPLLSSSSSSSFVCLASKGSDDDDSSRIRNFAKEGFSKLNDIAKEVNDDVSKFTDRAKDDASKIKNIADDFAEDVVEEIKDDVSKITGQGQSGESPSTFVDEWGEKSGPESEPATRFPDPRGDDDEWGGVGNGSTAVGVEKAEEDEKLLELKRCIVDTVYGTDFGFRAPSEVRAEALELVAQLEAVNPTPAPTQEAELLDGNWVLVYTASSELLPLLAAGSTPLAKVEKISQRIDATNLTIVNSTTLSGPVATFTFSASATFEVRSPCRIQVEFKEGTFNPPEVKSNIDLPENLDIFGQKIGLSPVQQSLNPLQNAVASMARSISGQPPLKIPIPSERTKSWLLITYLDKDLRISRGDGGLFVLVKEGSPLLYQ